MPAPAANWSLVGGASGKDRRWRSIAKRQLQFWGIGLAIFVLVLWLLGSTLLPFLLGAALAYFLDPLADRLERLGLSRTLATAVIAIIAVLVFVLAAGARWCRR